MLRGGVIGAERLPSILETIERNARLQEQLVSDVLDVSRIITGKLRLDVRAGRSARSSIRDALDTVAPAAAAKGVRLQSTIDQPRRPGGRRRAAAAAGDLEPAVERGQVHAARRPRAGARSQRVNSHVEITVSDTGEGIDAEFLPHLFQRFKQADGTFTRAHSGLGLGLAISRHLVEAHGGRIEAQQPGQGTRARRCASSCR